MATPVTVDPLADPRWTRLVDRAPDGIGLPPSRLAAAAATRATATGSPRAASRLDDGGSWPGCRWRRSRAGSPGRGWSPCRSPISARRCCAERRARRSAAALERGAGRPAAVPRAAARGPRRRRVARGAPPGERFHHHVLPLEPDVAAVQSGASPSRRPCAACAARCARACAPRCGPIAPPWRRSTACTSRRGGGWACPRSRAGSSSASRRLFAEGLGFVLLVRAADRPVAAGGLPHLPRHAHLQVRRLRRAALAGRAPEQPAVHGGDPLGLRARLSGRSTSGGRTGARKACAAFKLSWGAEERELRYRHRRPGRAEGSARGRERALAALIRRSPPRGEPAHRRGAVPPCRLRRCAGSPGRC